MAMFKEIIRIMRWLLRFHFYILLPFFIFLIFFAGNLFLWHKAETLRRELIHSYSSNSAEQVMLTISSQIHERVNDLTLLTTLWNNYPFLFRKTRFENDAAALVDREKAYYAINFIDTSGMVIVSAPEGLKSRILNRNIGNYPERQKWREQARRNGVCVSSLSKLYAGKYDGAKSLIIWYPVFKEEKDSRSFTGFVSGVILLDVFIKNMIHRTVSPEYRYSIALDGNMVYSDSIDRNDSEFESKCALISDTVYGRNWSVKAYPGASHKLLLLNKSNYHSLLTATLLSIFVTVAVTALFIFGRRLRSNRRELRESQSRYSSLVEMSPYAVIICKNRKIVFANMATRDIFRYKKYEEYMGKDITEVAVSEPSLLLPDTENRGSASGAKHFEHYETVMKRIDGTEFPAEVYIKALDSQNEKLEQVMITDITERKKTEAILKESEERLRQSQKMEIVGRLTGGIAHDFNNLLTPIVSYADLLLQDLGSAGNHASDLNGIKEAALRARSLISQLLAFSSKQVLRTQVLDLSEAVNNMRSIITRLIGENIRTDFDFTPLATIKADPSQIEQIILNLIVNAKDAMPDGGDMHITTSVALMEGSEPVLYKGGLKGGKYVCLRISDSGSGMDPETIRQIFEPFFTTKEKGRGTGLGLAIVYGIVKQHAGAVDVASESGKGTVFSIYFPFCSEPLINDKNEHEQARKPVDHATILFVEDERIVRLPTCRILERNGYSVIEAENGEQALRILKENDNKINLLITDMIMPGISGRQLFHQIRESMPELQVLYISGYTEDVFTKGNVLGKNEFFLQKPFTISEFISFVSGILEKSIRSSEKTAV
jgi:two-component system, cell cycle sensor histidine kinase and response regulator CckA